MIGTKIYKDNYDRELYHECASWCNKTQQGSIEDKGDYYEVVVNQYYVSQEVQEMKAEIDNLKKYLSNTDYMVIKCLERGIDMSSEYPTEYSARQNARNRINELESILN